MSPIPVILLTGFLGAGKTTLLHGLLRSARQDGRRLAVVINEFGAVDVDGALLRAQEIEAIASVAGGCACCSGQDDFVAALQELAWRSPDKRPDAIIVEASGLADPVLLLELLAVPELKQTIRPATVIAVADVADWNRAAATMGDLLRRQVALADVLVLSKVDIASPQALEAVQGKLAALNGRAAQFTANKGALDFASIWPLILQPIERNANSGPELATEHASAHTFFCPLPHPVERLKLEAALAALGEEVWRAKGFLRLQSEPGLWLLQYTAGEGDSRHQLASIHLPFGMEEPELGLVFIGAQLPVTELMRIFGGHRLLALF